MKKRILSAICSLLVLCSMVLSISVNVNAEETDDADRIVDGSLLTDDEYSQGVSSNSIYRGEHLMTGDSIISKVGNGKIYVYGQTTANHDVDFVAVLLYIEKLNKSEEWEHVDSYSADARNTYYVIVDDTLKVDRGYYYRVHCEHFAGNDDEEMYDSAISFTDGIMIP